MLFPSKKWRTKVFFSKFAISFEMLGGPSTLLNVNVWTTIDGPGWFYILQRSILPSSYSIPFSLCNFRVSIKSSHCKELGTKERFNAFTMGTGWSTKL